MRGTALGVAGCVATLALAMAGPVAAYNGSIVFPLQQGDALYPQEQASLVSAQRLDALLAAARRGGHPVKVAMFTADSDFGSRPELYGHPERAAEVLDELLRPLPGQRRDPLIVVMPAGLAARNVPGADRALVRTVPVDLRADASQVVAAAGLAVQAFERRHGSPVAPAFTGAEATSSRSTPAAVASILLALLASLAVAAALASRLKVPADSTT